VVTVGSRLQQKYCRSLPDVKVEMITPGILEKLCTESTPLTKVVKKFNVFMFGRASFEDQTLKGYDIVADAIGSLGKRFELTFVKHNQLTICGYCNEQDERRMMFHEADLVTLPYCTESFGLVGLEAISAGVSLLVSDESGIANALEKVKGGDSVIVETDNARNQAQRIEELSSQTPEEREQCQVAQRELQEYLLMEHRMREVQKGDSEFSGRVTYYLQSRWYV